MQLEKLIADRETAREDAYASEDTAEIEKLRDQIAQAGNRGKDTSELVEKRDALKAKRDAKVQAIGAEIWKARREARAAELAKKAVAYEKLSTTELEAAAHDVAAKRRALKAEQRAINTVLAKRHAVERVKEQLAKMSPEEVAALKAELGLK